MFVLSYAHPKSVKDILLKTELLAENQIEVYLGEVEYEDVNDSTMLSESTGTSSARVKPMQSNLSSTPRNALLVKAVPEEMEKIADVISRLDRKPRIIELEVQVCEANERAMKELGVSIKNILGNADIGTAWTEQPGEKKNALHPDGIFEAFSIGSFYRSPLDFIATLNLQIEEDNVTILAQPTLSTVEGKQAIFFAGESIPYISSITVTQTGVTQEIDFLDIGITLNFKPRLDADGMLTIDVNPIVSSLVEFRIIGDAVEAPRTTTRQLATTVRVADGEPFILAGLINEREKRTMEKVPLLGDLPLIGRLFRNKGVEDERTEIIIIVTPRIHD
ncbi:type II secretion system protein GspD [bacterium]|nr:type II secretion system protein GspD [bacterium]